MKIENLLNNPLWQMTGEEFMFLSKSVASDSNTRQPEVVVDASSPKYVYGLSGIAQLFGCRIPTANRFPLCSGRREPDAEPGLKTVINLILKIYAVY